MDALRHYREVWVTDTEYHAPAGELPLPVCVCAREVLTGRTEQRWLWDQAEPAAPWSASPSTLHVAYFSSSEVGIYLAVGWPVPARNLDLYVEFRNLTCGLPVPCGNSLLGALTYFGLDGMAAVEKDSLRGLAIRGGPFTDGERAALLAYCQADVDATARLLAAMLPAIDFPRALIRGRYMIAVARMEANGIPLDMEAFSQLRDRWNGIKGRLVREMDKGLGVFVPADDRPINPESRLGAAILEEARDHNVSPQQLARVLDDMWAQERDALADVREARKLARREAGVTGRQLQMLEEAGHDHASFPGWDETAQNVASRHPSLGVGNSLFSEGGEDDIDYGGRLWEVLRDRDEKVRPKHDPALLRQAAEHVAACPLETSSDGPMRFSASRFAGYLVTQGIAWPRQPSDVLALDDDTFREMARTYPREIGPLRELRYALSQLRLNSLSVGSDGRNRCLLSPFASRTGRNQPSNAKFIFGPATWLRSLIQPGPGRAVAYCDWSAQELGIAAALSGDTAMQEAYASGDPYIYLARRAGDVPADATKATHAAKREQFKVVSLGVLYGLSADGLARRLGVAPCRGRELLHMHQETFRQFWRWSDAIEVQGMLGGQLRTVFGWTVRAGSDANPRSLRNFPMQGNGAEMMRLACCLATERGIQVGAPVHDALLIEGPADGIEAAVAGTQQAMREASEIVLPGFPLRTDAKITRHPERYSDDRGREMWETVQRLLAEVEQAEAVRVDL